MNSNTIRTLLTWAAIIATGAVTVFGCSTDAVTGAIDCSASWVGPKFAGMLTMGLLILNQIMKAVDGTGLFKKPGE